MTISVAVATGSGVTVSTTEFSAINSSTSIATSTTVGIYQFIFDGVANMVAGDEYELAVQEKAVSGGTQRRTVLANLIGAQGGLWISPSMILGVGWDFTMKRLAGSDRAVSWSIRGVT